jgi:hypothetical protein
MHVINNAKDDSFRNCAHSFSNRTEDGDRDAGDSLSPYNNVPFAMSYHEKYQQGINENCFKDYNPINGW